MIRCIKDDIEPRTGVRYTRLGCGCPLCEQLVEDWRHDYRQSLADAGPEDDEW